MTRSVKGLGNAVYKIEYWNVKSPDALDAEGPYSTKGAAKGRLTRILNGWNYSGQAPYVEGRVLELTGEWVEVA